MTATSQSNRRRKYLEESGRGPRCLVEFCRERCPALPDNAEVNRISHLALCACGLEITNKIHLRFAYPSGMLHCIRDCRGNYWHT